MENVPQSQVNQEIDEKFSADAKKVDTHMAIGAMASLLVLALTSVVNLNTIGKMIFNNLFSNVLIVLLASAMFVFIVLSMTDIGLSTYLPFYFRERLSGVKNLSPARQKYAKWVGWMCVLQIFFTTTLSLSGLIIFAGQIVGSPTTENVEEITKITQEAYDKKLAYFDEAVNDAESSEDKRISNATKKAKGLLSKAIHSKGSNMANLYKNGNEWSTKAPQLGMAILQAEAEGKTIIVKEEQLLDSLKAQRTAFITNQSTADNTTLSGAIGLSTLKLNDYNDKKLNTAIVLFLITIGSCISFIVLTYMRAMYKVSTNENPHEQKKGFTTSLSGLIKNTFQLMTAKTNKMSFSTAGTNFKVLDQALIDEQEQKTKEQKLLLEKEQKLREQREQEQKLLMEQKREIEEQKQQEQKRLSEQKAEMEREQKKERSRQLEQKVMLEQKAKILEEQKKELEKEEQEWAKRKAAFIKEAQERRERQLKEQQAKAEEQNREQEQKQEQKRLQEQKTSQEPLSEHTFGKVFLKNSVPIYEHRNKNGDVKYYDLSNCSSMLRKYQKRLDTANKNQKPKPIQNNQNWVNIWTKAIAEIEAMK